jgi:lysophospholipase L1-like esterase
VSRKTEVIDRPSRGRWTGPVGAVIVLASLALAVATVTASGSLRSTRYYLALGDSLSTGFQPTLAGEGVETRSGYVDDLYGYERHKFRRLGLMDVGCPGDTTTSLLTGRGNYPLASRLHCDRSGGSQLAAAIAFLHTHHRAGEVPLITLDIGINDLNRCAELVDPGACLSRGERQIATNLPRILRTLRAAAPAGTRFAAMTLYDTYLGKRVAPGVPAADAALFLSAYHRANEIIAASDAAAGFVTADVAGAFDTYDTVNVIVGGSPVAANLLRTCALTWSCSPPPIDHNIHPNNRGYRVIARQFERVIGRIVAPHRA